MHLPRHVRYHTRTIPCHTRFIKGIYWATGLFLRTPFTEGCAGANKNASPPGRQQEQASKQRRTLSPTNIQFSSVQFSYIQSSVQLNHTNDTVPTGYATQ